MRLSYWNQGIGPNSWWVIRYLLPYNKLFHYAACIHDKLYTISWEKHKADEMFYRMMLAVSKTRTQIIFAKIYYKLVVLFWDYYFNYK